MEKVDGIWIDIVPKITKLYIKRTHSSTKVTPIQASLKKNEGFVYQNFLDKRKKIKLKFQGNDLIKRADLKKTFSKSDTIIWSYELYKNTETVNDTIPTFYLDNLLERYNEALLKTTDLAMKENFSVMKTFRIT